GEVLVLAEAEAIARHVHTATEARVVVVQGDQLGALVRREYRRRLRVAPLPQGALDAGPVEIGQACRDVRHVLSIAPAATLRLPPLAPISPGAPLGGAATPSPAGPGRAAVGVGGGAVTGAADGESPRRGAGVLVRRPRARPARRQARRSIQERS